MQNVKERLFGRREKAYGFYENLRPGEKEFLQDFLKFLDSLVRAGEFRTDKFGSDNLLVLAVGGMLNKKSAIKPGQHDIDLRVVFFSNEEEQRKQSTLTLQGRLETFLKEKGVDFKQTAGINKDSSTDGRGWGGWRLIKSTSHAEEDSPREEEVDFLTYDVQPIRFITASTPERRSFDIFVSPFNAPAASKHLEFEKQQGNRFLILLGSSNA